MFSEYIDRLRTSQPNVYAYLAVNNAYRFKYVFICLPGSQTVLKICRMFITMNSTFMKNYFKLILLITVTIDATNRRVPQVWALVESENKDSWRYFLCHLMTTIP